MSDGHRAKRRQKQPPPPGTHYLSRQAPQFKMEDDSNHPHAPVPLQPRGHDEAYSFAPAPPQPHPYSQQPQQPHPHGPPYYSQQPPQPHPHGPPYYPQWPPRPHGEQDAPPPPQQLYPHGPPHYPQQPQQPHPPGPPHYPQRPPRPHGEQDAPPPPQQLYPHSPQQPLQPPQPHQEQDAPPPQPHQEQDAPPPPQQQPHGYSHTDTSGNPPLTIITHRKKTRAPRASVACESCRDLKAKCDEEKPCKNCREKNTECTYRETAPKVPSDDMEVCRELGRLGEAINELKPYVCALQEAVQGLVRQQQKSYAAVDAVPRQTVPPDNPTVLGYYGTSAGVLLSWPTISERVQRVLKNESLPLEYPTRYEQQRRNIRGHGRCEGVIGPRPLTHKGTPFQPTGDLDLHPDTVWKYVESYKENIQNMYPLIIPEELHALVEMVLQSEASRSQAASLERPQHQTAQKGLKRKRALEGDSGDGACAAPSELRLGQPSCSIESALVLMVLALGQIGLHRRECTPAVPSTSAGADSGDDATETRDIDENIGRDYFTTALSIFGAFRGDYKLEHVWVYILGSLYYDQLGRPIQSLELVTDAGHYLQDIIRPDLERYGKIRANVSNQHDSRDRATRVADNRNLVTAWICLLHERELLSELDLRPSNMISFEQQLPYPDGEVWVEQGFDSYVLETFALQTYLYGLVNQIYDSLYRRQDQAKYPIIKACIDSLQTLRSPNAAFQNGPLFNHEQPATNVLAARLRAAYWRARGIVFRSSIQRILAFNHEKRCKEMAGRALQGDMEGLDELAEEAEVVSRLNVELARRGIEALVQSTRAFHDLPDQQFVVTNVFGTAHAQWGNLLILDSVQRDPDLGRFIDNATVDDLFLKTIAFLERVAEPSSSLSRDLRILRGLSEDQ